MSQIWLKGLCQLEVRFSNWTFVIFRIYPLIPDLPCGIGLSVKQRQPVVFHFLLGFINCLEETTEGRDIPQFWYRSVPAGLCICPLRKLRCEIHFWWRLWYEMSWWCYIIIRFNVLPCCPSKKMPQLSISYPKLGIPSHRRIAPFLCGVPIGWNFCGGTTVNSKSWLKSPESTGRC